MKRVFSRVVEILALMVTDVGLVWLAVIAGYFLRIHVLPAIFEGLSPSATVPLSFYWDHYYLSILWPLLFAYEGVYTRRLPMGEETKRLWTGSTVAMILTIVILFYFKRAFIFSRVILLLAWAILLVLLPLVRTGMKRLMAMHRFWHRRVLIIGGGEGVPLLIKSLKRNRALGFVPFGILDDRLDTKDSIEGVPVLGDTTNLERELGRNPVDAVILALSTLSSDRFSELANVCESRVGEVLIAPDFLGVRVSGLEVEPFDSGILLKFRNDLLRPVNSTVKRAFDIAMAGLGLVVSLPFIGLLILAVRWSSEGPAFFVQERCGRMGRPFRCLKFRTMFLDSDRRLEELLRSDPKAREEWETFKKLKKADPRVTGIGRLLRRFSLDELPQLFNVLRGDMSLVGPRPYLEEEITDSGTKMSVIARVRPGMTGFWQVSGRSEVSFRDRLVLEEFYVRNWSLWQDFVIILRTFLSVMRREGAY